MRIRFTIGNVFTLTLAKAIHNLLSGLTPVTPVSPWLLNLPEETTWDNVRISYETLLGSGHYGHVFLGHWRHERLRTISADSMSIDSIISEQNMVTELVAVKMARSGRRRKRSHEASAIIQAEVR